MNRALAVAVGGATVMAGVLLPTVAANAAEDVITVTSLGTAGNQVAGVCEATTGTGDCTLRGALEIANASVNPDGVSIVFDAALDGAGQLDLGGLPAAQNMWTTRVGATGGNHSGTVGTTGARFLIDSDVPVSIDFTNLDGITDNDLDAAGFYVASDSVTLVNLAGLRAGAAGIAISGSDVLVADSTIADPATNWSENGVVLLDGASDVTLRNLTIESQYWAAVMIDGTLDPAQQVTVTNIVIDGLISRGHESGIGHIDIEDTTIVNGLTIVDSTFGALGAEAATSHAVYLNTALTVTDLVFANNTVERGSGGEKNVFYFENSSNSVYTDTVIADNTFTGISTAQPLSRIIGDNTATWNGLLYTGNTAEFTRGIRMSGTVTDALFDDNTFTDMREPSDAGLTLGRELSNVTVSNNLFDTVWAHDAISVEGTSATNVVIEDNQIHDFYADVSRSAIGIDVVGTGNVVRNNEIVTDWSRKASNGGDLPDHINNHWAVYFRASAADANTSVGWSILSNHIDGFDGTTDAPIVFNGTGKLLVTGNTFGPDTEGSADPETEEGRAWFFWNVLNDRSNNTVQTYRAENVTADGTNATFTAVKPANESGNNDATAPVTLHVYWTAADGAEEYLGAIENVTPGQTVSIATGHTSGFLRLQTVDADGFTSQYSSIDQEIVVVPAAPAVTEVGKDAAAGTGDPEAMIEVRNARGDVVGVAIVAEDGTWTVTGLTCGTDYVAVQLVDDVESEATPFTTAACPVDPGTPVTPGTGTLTTTGQTGDAALMGLAAALLLALLGGALLLVVRRRKA